MSGGQGLPIAAVDYNAIRSDVISILGTGTGQRGYNQPIVSQPVFAGNTITKAQWDALRLDLLNITLHQTGIYAPIVTLGDKAVVGYGAGSPNTNYNTVIEQAILNRFNLGAGQSVVTSAISQTRVGPWATQSQCTVTVNFGTADKARYFFNSGGKLRFTSNRTAGTSSQQNGAWSNLLNTTVGTVTFSATIPSVINFYSLTTSYQTVYALSASTPYSANYYEIAALANSTGANNSTGTASTVTFRITWRDNYVDSGPELPPGDYVDGQLSINVEEVKATGALLPSGTFTVLSPTYSISPISAF